MEENVKNNKKVLLIVLLIVIIILSVLIGYKVHDYLADNEDVNENINETCESNDECECSCEGVVNYGSGTMCYETDLDKTFISLAKNSLYNISETDLIESSNSSFLLSEQFIGEMYKENISDEYKVLYLIRYLADLYDSLYGSNLLWSNFDGTTGLASIELSIDTINEIVGMKFANTTISNGFSTSYSGIGFYDIYSISCDNDICTIVYVDGVGDQADLFPHYNSKLISSTYNTETGYHEYIYQAYYIDNLYDENVVTRKETDIVAGVYDKKDGNLVYTISYDEFYNNNGNKKVNYFDEYSSYLTNIPTYKYTFDGSKLVSAEQIS